MMFAIISVNTSYGQSKSELRKQVRSEKQEAYMQKLEAALKNGQFNFTAQTFQSNVGNPIPINYPNNFVGIYGDVIDVQLPYYSFTTVNTTPNLINFVDAPINYTVTTDGTNYYVTINVKTTANSGNTYIIQIGQYSFHFAINARSGFAILTLAPQFSSVATYNGFVQID